MTDVHQPAPPLPDARSGAPSVHPLASPRAWVILLVTVVLSLAIDLWSKQLAFERVAPSPVVVNRDEVIRVKQEIDPRAITEQIVPLHPPKVVVAGVLNFTLVLNPGAVFGVGPGQRVFFVTFTVVALSFAMFMFAKWTTARDAWAHIALGLLIGGGLGNLYDRLMFACVRDFIHPLPKVEWPFGWSLWAGREVWPYVSNLADLFLLIGILMLLRHLWRRDAGREAGREAGVQDASTGVAPERQEARRA